MANDDIKRKYLDAARKAKAVNSGQIIPPAPKVAPKLSSQPGDSGSTPNAASRTASRQHAQRPSGKGGCLRVIKWMFIISLMLLGFLYWVGSSVEESEAVDEVIAVDQNLPPNETTVAPADEAELPSDSNETILAQDSVDNIRPEVAESQAQELEVGYGAQMRNTELVSEDAVPHNSAVPSFSCPDASRPAHLFQKSEIVICNNVSLAALDVKLSGLYEAAIKAPSADVWLLSTEQKRWINKRNQCEDSVQCLIQSYEYRIEKLASQ